MDKERQLLKSTTLVGSNPSFCNAGNRGSPPNRQYQDGITPPVCYFCVLWGEKDHEHKLRDRDGKYLCTKFLQRIGCSLCKDKNSEPHIELDCQNSKEVAGSKEFRAVADKFFKLHVAGLPAYQQRRPEDQHRGSFQGPRVFRGSGPRYR